MHAHVQGMTIAACSASPTFSTKHSSPEFCLLKSVLIGEGILLSRMLHPMGCPSLEATLTLEVMCVYALTMQTYGNYLLPLIVLFHMHAHMYAYS